jgi:hypothetical protein
VSPRSHSGVSLGLVKPPELSESSPESGSVASESPVSTIIVSSGSSSGFMTSGSLDPISIGSWTAFQGS